jgi:DNA-directed RNA polymerase subunit K/omega
MDYKKTNAPVTTITRDLKQLEGETGNIYETVEIIARRANQISVELKEELSKKLEEFASYTDNLEEVFENREQIEISRFYERLPKPTLIALQEYIEDKIYFRMAQPEPDQEK